jgi:hypothetical protein
MILAALLALPLSPAHATPRRVKKSVEVTAQPFPGMMVAVDRNTGCEMGAEGVHKVIVPLRVPFEGLLSVTLDGFTGNWDLSIRAGRDEQLGGDFSAEEDVPSKATAWVERGRVIQLVACNWMGSETATLSYELVERRIPERTTTSKPYERVEEFPFAGPDWGTRTPFFDVGCYPSQSLGCIDLHPFESDLYVSVEITDTSGTSLDFDVDQWSDKDSAYRFLRSCGETREPVELMRDLSQISVLVFASTCEDGSPSIPTSGTIKVTFSNHR